jgi:hypothetical protein
VVERGGRDGTGLEPQNAVTELQRLVPERAEHPARRPAPVMPGRRPHSLDLGGVAAERRDAASRDGRRAAEYKQEDAARREELLHLTDG